MTASDTFPLTGYTLPERIVDGRLNVTRPSTDGSKRYALTIPLDRDEPITCSCWGYTTHKHCKHQIAADELRHRCRETLAVLRPSAPEFLRLQRAWLAPENVHGLTLAYLCACYLLDSRAREQQEAA